MFMPGKGGACSRAWSLCPEGFLYFHQLSRYNVNMLMCQNECIGAGGWWDCSLVLCTILLLS